ncbi:DEAD/DEAH box helicase [Algisphaera agarilytica]|uniref:Superfamily II DNA/RNA helicase n=1 Tax=Algisphaera agarilytica TaxID=1385975 RepID=A0A7X0H3L0_9BACT|nr:DEAD/DEAH box helicase [Algisphaera agarilytica]MBB6428422.1 superfamily II DNA/RNA helicase [Algisphaera agarilytica]
MSETSREDILLNYLDQLPFEPYPVQEEALMRYFERDEPGGGVLACAPTGTGKTVIGEAALYEALVTGSTAYYTTPLIALTEQKFTELQDAAERWGFSRDQIGLVTGNRSVNSKANVLVVVAEILLNRLLHPEAFDFTGVSAVVMDEFHSFAEPERGIVWELSLSLLPEHVRLMLLSATVGNASLFLSWLRQQHGRDLTLVQGNERRVPLEYHWIGEELLPDQLAEMVRGDEDSRKTPALVFCFDRAKCWATADLLRGRDMLVEGQQATLAEKIDALASDGFFDHGAGPKLKRILLRGVGVHHAGLLPKYRRLVEELFQEKLLSFCVCTETLAAGMNLPARSVVLTELLKGPKGKKKLIAASNAHQMFGRAGRPQFDTQGHVFAIAHEDDVKIHRHKLKIEQIPEDTKDPKLMTARKKLVKKTPKRREGVQYWSEPQFESLQTAEPGKLVSKGHLPWRLLAFLLDNDSDVSLLRDAASKRLMPEPDIAAAQRHLTKQLVTLHEEGYVALDPAPPSKAKPGDAGDDAQEQPKDDEPAAVAEDNPLAGLTLGGGLNLGGAPTGKPKPAPEKSPKKKKTSEDETETKETYAPLTATKTDKLDLLLKFRAVPPLYGVFLLDYLGQAEHHERLQIFESLLEMPGSVARSVRVPWPQDLPPGAMTLEAVDPALIQAGLFTQDDMYPPPPHEQDRPFGEPPRFPITLGEKLHLLFQHRVSNAGSFRITPVWVAGDLLDFGGDFNKYITGRELQTQEGMIFRHLLRLILLCNEFAAVTPLGVVESTWQQELKNLAESLTASCRAIDPQSTDQVLTTGA